MNDLFSSNSTYYYWVGKTTAWPNDTSPPAANQSYQEMTSVYHDMVYGKLLANTDNIYALAAVVPWANGTVYADYNTTDQNFFNEDFCVYTVSGTQWNIYKCIDNAGGIPSTAQPSLRPIVGCFTSSDGYTWKYMYTTAASSFQQDNFAAITPNTVIEAAAVPGTIDAYRIYKGGTNYQGYNEGTIRDVVSPNQIQLANTAIPIDSFYVGAQLYLKSGLGAGQISNVVAYIGASQIATVNPSFATYIDMQVTNVNGTVANSMLVQQITENVSYLYSNGYFNVGDTVVQSDTGWSGSVLTVNSSGMVLTNLSNLNTMLVGGNSFPIYDTNAVVPVTGVVSINSASNQLFSNSANASYANLMTLAPGQYVQVGNVAAGFGNNTWSNVRRITSITNANTANVDIPFVSNLVANHVFSIPNAVEPVSTTLVQSNAVIVETNLTALTLQYANVTPNNSSYVLGELIKEYSNTGMDLAANGLVSFVNSSTLILSGVQGSFTVGDEVVAYGTQSNTTAIITNISTYPNITLGDVLGTFQSGVPMNVYNLGNTTPAGNAVPVSFIFIPSENVQYILGPCVTLQGDGSNAQAYAVVNTAPGSVFNITDVVPINVGAEYTYANVVITAPANYGSGANVSAVVAPVTGHGGDPYTELGARNLGIAFNFGNSSEEVYKFPNYGSYRRAGILKNPTFQELFVNISPTLRNNLSISGNTTAFVNNEIIFQPATNAGARFLSGNSTIIQIDNIGGTFANTGNTTIQGLVSNTTALVGLVNALAFNVNGNQPIYDLNGSNSVLIQVTNSSQIVLANTGGKFGTVGDTIYDPTINSYATVLSVYTANDTVNSSNVYGLRFNQTSRLTLSSNTGPYQVGERIVQAVQNANALVIDTTHEIDIMYTLNSGTFSSGIVLTDNTSGGNAVITSVNSSYMRLTGVQGSWSNADHISCLTGNGQISAVYPVLVVGDVLSNFVGYNYTIQGQTSGSLGIANIPNSILNPDLTKNTGEILYVNDFIPFTQNLSSQQIFVTIFGF